jgi:fructose/tagatose bisphosphate aldolase
MPRSNLIQILRNGHANTWAVGCFAVHNLEFIQAVVRAAEIEAAPAMLSLDAEGSSLRDLEDLAAAALHAAERACVPIAVHLDHARRFDLLLAGLDAGITSVMFDGSSLPWEEKIALTRKAVHLAHDAGAHIEGEAGPLCETADMEQARLFAEATGVDCMAVTLPPDCGRTGPALVRELARHLSLPLVLHGGSTLPPALVGEAVRAGIRKVNVRRKLSRVFAQTLLQNLDPESGCLAALDSGVEALTHCICGHLRLFGSNGKAGAPE